MAKTFKYLAPQAKALLTAAQKKLVSQGLSAKVVFVVKGPQGPTGKTTLANALRELGVQVYEQHEIVEIDLSAPIIKD